MRARGSFFNGGTIAGNIVTPLLKNGSGSPEGAVTAGVGAIYQDTTNGKLYEKVSGTGNTGWREVSPSVSGTYTPTITPTLNLDSVTPGTWRYVRVGDQVIISGYPSMDPTASGPIQFRATIPIASNFTEISDATGAFQPAGYSGDVRADATNDAIVFYSNNGVTTAFNGGIIAMYTVLP